MKTSLLWLLFGLPPLWSVYNKFQKSSADFGDYKAVACAGLRSLAGQPLYDMQMSCDGMTHPSVFVYHPAVAEVAGFLIKHLSLAGFSYLYVALYVLSIALMLGVVFLCPEKRSTDAPKGWLPALPGTRLQRWTFMAFLVGSAYVWGNVAVISHGLIFLCALFLGVSVIPFVLAVAVAGVIKPVFLVYLTVLLLMDRPLYQRLLPFVVGAVIGLWPTVSFAMGGGAVAEAWQGLLRYFVYKDAPGDGYYGWLSLMGLEGSSPLASFGYLLLATALVLSGYALAEGLKLKAFERMWLGLSLSALLIPRLMPQDFFLLGPGLVCVALKVSALRSPNGFLARVRDWGPSFLFYVCLMTLLGHNLDLGRLTAKLATLALSLYVIAMGYLSFYSDRERLMAPIRAALPRKTLEAA